MMRKGVGYYRMCIVYRDVNSRTIKDVYPTPSADIIIDVLRGPRYISKIALKQALLQVPMEKSNKKYTAFYVPGICLV